MRKYFIDKCSRYERIIQILCKYKNINRNQFINILKDNECKYLLFLLVKKYGCCDIEVLNKDFPGINKKSMNNNLKIAQEKLLLNKKIRDMYFEAEELMER